jgi:hypothetical protein
MGKITVENLDAPANENQTRLFLLGTATEDANNSFSYLNLRNAIDVSGYDSDDIFYAYGTLEEPKKVIHSNNRYGTDPLFGEFTLAQGVAFVQNNNIIDNLIYNPLKVPSVKNKILITPMLPMKREGVINKELNGATVGTGTSNLPTHWNVTGSGLGTLTLQVLGFDKNRLDPYIDIRVSGTASTASFNIAFTSTNTQRIQTVLNDIWDLSFTLDLLSGSMANVTNSFVTATYDVSNTLISSAVISSSTFVITSTEQKFSKPFTVTNGSTTQFHWGIRFNTTSGQAVDFTIRIKNPSAILNNTFEESRILVSEVRNKLGFIATSYKADGSINTLDNRNCSYVIS